MCLRRHIDVIIKWYEIITISDINTILETINKI